MLSRQKPTPSTSSNPHLNVKVIPGHALRNGRNKLVKRNEQLVTSRSWPCTNKGWCLLRLRCVWECLSERFATGEAPEASPLPDPDVSDLVSSIPTRSPCENAGNKGVAKEHNWKEN